MRYKNMDRSFFRFVTKHAFNSWTDRQTEVGQGKARIYIHSAKVLGLND